jgi:CheY-like chemotaxis protein
MDLRILVVDDSQATRRVLSALISSHWTVCGTAENGRVAVRKFRDLKPDLVLLDLVMPDIDGIEVGRRMHAIDPSIPLILFTLSDVWGWEGPARKAGISRVICKTESWKLMASIKEIVSELERSLPDDVPPKRARLQSKAASH